jgi:anaerobic sulfite reductase subunit B
MSLAAMRSYLPTPARITGVVRESPDTRTFALDLAGDDAWRQPQPGQFVMLSLLGHGEAAFTVSSWSGDCDRPQRIYLTVRRVGSLTTALFDLAEGSVVGLRGPFGRGFPVWSAHAALLFVAGGCGLAPLRAAIDAHLARRHGAAAVTIVYGAREPASRILRADLERWRELPHVSLLDPVEHADSSWPGRRGAVDDALRVALAAGLPDFVAASGPPGMLSAVARRLLAGGVPATSVWFAIERQMKCAVGLCGRCYVGDRYACTDGPVFSLDELVRLDPATAGARTL